ncbi:hypothetical protein AGOR_G00115360 [Albula goreensis]|uniref:Ectodysplasin-A receptor-associated adapter protein n=1 Tax=Albula goreensis TaxID=1534307 RepID=A0A8T3DF62_9TELE|nr:hypothetical protein AGOR_G00115360 [Albula goreensis]
MESVMIPERVEQIISGPVEDMDPSSLLPNTQSLRPNYPVQVTEPKEVKNDPFRQLSQKQTAQETLPYCTESPRYLVPDDRIRQPVDESNDINFSADFKGLHYSESPCKKCCCPAPPPKIRDLMNDADLLYDLRLKLDPNHCTIKNWKNFASRWGMSYDELMLLEHQTQGSAQSPTQEFLLRYNEKSVTELTELCQHYQRIDVLRVLQRWVAEDWPSRWQKAH